MLQKSEWIFRAFDTPLPLCYTVVVFEVSQLIVARLDSFLALVRMRNFSRAAESLFVTQPAFSRTIAELEKEVGCQLFLRTSRPIQLTQAGEVLYRWASIIEKNLSDMEAEMALACRGIVGRLRIGYYGEPQIAILNQGIEAVKQRMPEIKWSIRRDNPAQLEKLLLQDELDAIFLHLPHAKAFDWIEYETVVPGGMCALLPSSHPLATQETVSIQELVHEPYVAFPRDVSPYAYDLEMQAFQDANAIPRVSVLVEDIEALGIMVAGGNGITLMSRASAEVLQENGLPVCAVGVAEYPRDFDLVLAWKRGTNNPYLDIFKTEICQII